MIHRCGKTAGVILALVLTLLAGVASAQDKKIVLRVADYLPANHLMSEPLVKFWMNAVTKAAPIPKA